MSQWRTIFIVYKKSKMAISLIPGATIKDILRAFKQRQCSMLDPDKVSVSVACDRITRRVSVGPTYVLDPSQKYVFIMEDSSGQTPSVSGKDGIVQ